ncbi:Coenzyme F420 hydrogenase/dehydrogenase, beta subunit C-terminal domain [Halococcoides cellulosivorans]|uniref:Coenzyme F420 hydrogenase n=1 Tax=Halococcoides cellulosivorans TaxID=1679096 RepID=A0A2R4X226_9EURY|nr:Coenzyme F420 hydrogenase/dehydrogenase, beta subunit C-terminal domain [Halococcoides cellulosivorans]AWB27859.1 coenzyme F420 hydrogenase [Halococcoides cellulosivorans]
MSDSNPSTTDALSDASPRVPSVGADPRESTRDVDPPRNKVWFRDLDEAVIAADRCVRCAACVSACPSDSIGIADSDRRPTLVKMCTGCSRCWDTCPRAGLRYEALPGASSAATPSDASATETSDAPATAAPTDDLPGPVRAAVAARGSSEGQHGGVVSTLLADLLAAGQIDGAVVASGAPLDAPTPELVTDPAEARASGGTVFDQPLQLAAVPDLIATADLPEDPKLALVGTPCVHQGVAALAGDGDYRDPRFDEHPPLDAIDLRISLWCTQALEQEHLAGVLQSAHAIDPGDVVGLDLVGNGLKVELADGTERSVPADSVAGAIPDGCLECGDATGRTADIAVGTIGSEREESTVLVRTARGERALAATDLDTRPIEETGPIAQIATWNRERARRESPREIDPDGGIWIPYAAHREAYDGTDRAPVAFNPARIQQYEEWC